jgi:hypothetical protein
MKVVPNYTFLLHKFSGKFSHSLAIFHGDNSTLAIIHELENLVRRPTFQWCRGWHWARLSEGTGHVDVTRRSGRSERCRLSPRRRRLVHAGETPSMPSSAPARRSLLPFHRLQQSQANPRASLDFAPLKCFCCRCSVLELHHEALVPTSLTTGATHRFSHLASMSSSAEPPLLAIALSGEPLLPKIPQSNSHFVVLP